MGVDHTYLVVSFVMSLRTLSYDFRDRLINCLSFECHTFIARVLDANYLFSNTCGVKAVLQDSNNISLYFKSPCIFFVFVLIETNIEFLSA